MVQCHTEAFLGQPKVTLDMHFIVLWNKFSVKLSRFQLYIVTLLVIWELHRTTFL